MVSRNVTIGQTVAASFQTPTLFLIATDLTKMQVDTNVSESDIGGIKDGNKASFTVDAFPERTFAGTVTQVRQAPQTVQNVVTYDVVVSVDNTDLLLKPGMTAAMRIVIDQRSDVLRVPNQALRYSPAGLQRHRNRPTQTAGLGAARRQAGAVPVASGLDDDTFTEIVERRTASQATRSSSPSSAEPPTAAVAAAALLMPAAEGQTMAGTDHQARAHHADLPCRRRRRACAARREPRRSSAASSSPSWARPARASRR